MRESEAEVQVQQESNLPKRSGSFHLLLIGLALTSFYLSSVYFVFENSLGELREMPLNEVGDFLAGAFAPIAFLWLVIGYFMQSSELRLQVNEISNMVEISRSELDIVRQNNEERIIKEKKALIPSIEINGLPFLQHTNSSKGGILELTLVNRGGKIQGCYLAASDSLRLHIGGGTVNDSFIWNSDETKKIKLTTVNGLFPDMFSLSLMYQDMAASNYTIVMGIRNENNRKFIPSSKFN